MRVCIIDDNEFLRDALSLCLSDAGHIAVCAANGDEAIELIARQQVDVVVTDINMPGLSGLALMTALRGRFPGVAIIAISGDPAKAPDGEAASAAADAFLPKPINASALRQLISRLAPAPCSSAS